ncbi:MAG: hypothetical protein HQL08_07945 [Nitrospirae bacterium]|nr:hypothetical protein [Nitrospirota bacterium]
MANRIAVSFEDDSVRVLYASTQGRNVRIRKTLLLKNEEFDAFLAGEKAREFIVVSDFKVSYSDLLTLPPAKDKYLGRIVESEIRKKNPELKEFSFSYTVLGETVREGRRVKEVFFFAVNNVDLLQIIQRFDKYKKTVKYIYPFAAALSRLINVLDVEQDEPQLCIAEVGLNKTLFLVKKGKIHFIRTAQAMEAGIHDLDVHDINMTVNYCRQTLRMTPASIFLLSNVCTNYDASMSFAVPASCVLLPSSIQAGREDATDYLAPIAAVLPGGETDSISVLPRQYALLAMQKKIVNSFAALFIFLSLAGLWHLKKDVTEILRLKREAVMLRTDIRDMVSNRQSYEMLTRQLGEYLPMISFVNTINAVPDIQAALISLSSVKTLRGDALQLNSASVTAAAGVLNMQLNGSLKAGKFADTNRHYRALIDEIKALKGVTVSSDGMDINSRNFHVEIQYRDK